MDPTILHVGLMLAVWAAGWATRHWTLPVAPEMLKVLGQVAQHQDLLKGHARLQKIARVGKALATQLPAVVSEVESLDGQAPAAPAVTAAH